MYPRVACEPPVGFVTVVDGPHVAFRVAIRDAESNNVQVSVWHDGNPSRLWKDLLLQPMIGGGNTPSSRDAPVTEATQRASDVRYFGSSLAPSVESLRFTIKFRVDHGEWQWLNDQDPKPDGTVLLQTQRLPTLLDDLLEGWDPQWRVQQQQHLSNASSSSWSLTAEVETSSASHSGWTSRRLGLPKGMARWFALVRHSAPWLGPRHGDTLFKLEKDALLASFLREDGLHLVCLATNGFPHLTTTIQADDNGHVRVVTRNDSQQQSESTVVVSVSKRLGEAIAAAVSVAKELLRGDHTDTDTAGMSPSPELERWYDALTYCTWNGLGQKLSEKRLLSALEQLEANGLDFGTLIIDDNWQSLDFKGSSNFEYKWSDFEANKEGFPHGLKHTISKIRTSYPKIRHIGVWHGIFGYWGGMDPQGNIVKRYKPRTARKQTGESYLPSGTVTTVQGRDVRQMYDDFYTFLADCGIDSVKTDAQFMPDYLADASDREDTVYAYQDAWLAAVEKHFQHRGLVSMSQTPQILFYTFLAPSSRPPYLARNSDDFFPDEPTSHAWHVFCNAHNSLLTQHLNVLPDWDMFQTAGQCAVMHAVARCLSGGPLYITDPPGEHDFEIIASMTAKSIDGRSIALRPASAAVAMEAYVPPHSDRLLRLGTAHREISMLGVLNVGGRAVDELVGLTSFAHIDPGKPYIVRSHFEKVLHGPMHPDSEMPVVLISLPAQDAEILSAGPVEHHGDFEFAVLGLLGKMTGPAAIREIMVEPSSSGDSVKISVTLKALGVFGFWLSRASQHHARGSVSATLLIDRTQTAVPIDMEGQDLLRFDVETTGRPLSGKASIETNAVLSIKLNKAGTV